MKVVDLEFTPIFIPYKKPYHWAQGITEGAQLILIKLITDKGIVGYGESIATPSSNAIISFLNQAKKLIIGKDIYENDKIFRDVYQYLFQAQGTCSAPRFASQVLCGIEIAFWDAKGKELNKPLFQLLGGKVAPSHAWVHLVAIECEVNIFGMAVKPNDIIHADRHGAVVVPEECVKELPSAIDVLTRREAVILEVARSPGFNVEILKKAMADSAEIH